MKLLVFFFTLTLLNASTWAAIGGGYYADEEKNYSLRMSENDWGESNLKELTGIPKQFEQQSMYTIEIYKRFKTKSGFKDASKPFKIFKNLLCGYEISKPDGINTHFVCEKKLGYPLSGAKYLITPPVIVQGLTSEEEYERCKLFLNEDYESLTCIANCKSSIFTPRKMSQGGYECE
jgi:hypothetical protein